MGLGYRELLVHTLQWWMDVESFSYVPRSFCELSMTTPLFGRVPRSCASVNPSLLSCHGSRRDSANQNQHTSILDAIDSQYEGQLVGKRVAIWARDYVSVSESEMARGLDVLIRELRVRGAKASLHSTLATDSVPVFGTRVEYFWDKWDALANADVLVVYSRREQYRGVDPGLVRWYMRDSVIMDACNCLNHDCFATGSFELYVSAVLDFQEAINRPNAFPSSLASLSDTELRMHAMVKVGSSAEHNGNWGAWSA
jgi:hypothetical protein